MPGLNLQGGFGAGGAVDQLRVLVAEAQRKQMEENRVAAQQAALAEEARQFNETQPIRLGQLDVSRGQLGIARDKLTQDADQFAALAPDRESVIKLRNIQGQDIAGRPEAETLAHRRNLDLLNARNLMDTGQQTQRQQSAIELANLNNAADLRQAQIAANARATQSEPLVPVEMPDGTQQYMPRSEAAGMRPATTRRPVLGQERQNLAYFNRAQEAAKVAEPLEPKFSNLASQTRLQYAPNFLQSPEGQQYRQAQRAFTEARLRKESGAAIPNSEYENDAKTYWMQPGDSPEIIAQKKSARQEVLDGLAFSAGSAYQEFYGTPFERKAPSAGGTIGGGQKDGEERPIPGIPGGVAKLIGGKWIRIK